MFGPESIVEKFDNLLLNELDKYESQRLITC